MKKEENTLLALNIIIESIDKLKNDIATIVEKGNATFDDKSNKEELITIISSCQSIEKHINLIAENKPKVIVEKVEIPKPFINSDQLRELSVILKECRTLYESVKIIPPQKVIHKNNTSNWTLLSVIIGFSFCIIAFLLKENNELKYCNENLAAFHSQIQKADIQLASKIDTMLLAHPNGLPDQNKQTSLKQQKQIRKSTATKMRQ